MTIVALTIAYHFTYLHQKHCPELCGHVVWLECTRVQSESSRPSRRLGVFINCFFYSRSYLTDHSEQVIIHPMQNEKGLGAIRAKTRLVGPFSVYSR